MCRFSPRFVLVHPDGTDPNNLRLKPHCCNFQCWSSVVCMYSMYVRNGRHSSSNNTYRFGCTHTVYRGNTSREDARTFYAPMPGLYVSMYVCMYVPYRQWSEARSPIHTYGYICTVRREYVHIITTPCHAMPQCNDVPNDARNIDWLIGEIKTLLPRYVPEAIMYFVSWTPYRKPQVTTCTYLVQYVSCKTDRNLISMIYSELRT